MISEDSSFSVSAAKAAGSQRLLHWIAIVGVFLLGFSPHFLRVYSNYLDLAERTQTVANVQAIVLGRYAAVQPDTWMFKSEHIAVILNGLVLPSDRSEVFYHKDRILSVGEQPTGWNLTRQAEFSAYANTEGTVVAIVSADSLHRSLLWASLQGAITAAILLWMLQYFVLNKLRAAQKAYQESNYRLEDLVSLSSDWFWEQDALYRFTKNSMGIFGSEDFQSLIGKCRWDINTNLTPAQWAAHREDLDARRSFVLRYSIPPTEKSGVVWAEIRGKARFDDHGAFVGYRGIGTDITERKVTEKTLRLAAIAFESQESMLITDANSVIKQVNKSFEKSTGYSAQEAIGKKPNLIRSQRHDFDFYRTMWQKLLQTGSWNGEVWNCRKNGEIYPVLLTISAVKNEEGQVVNYIGTHIDLTESENAKQRIEELAFFDALTHLPNRVLLGDRLHQTMNAVVRNACHGAILFIDLDNFKLVSDTLGRAVGDQLLIQTAQRLIDCLCSDGIITPSGDTVARLGGDEFVVVLGHLSTDADQATLQTKEIAEKILAVLGQPYILGDFPQRCTASIGATLFNHSNQSPEELLLQANLAMYRSKERGCNTIHFFDPAMQAAILKRANLENDLHRALNEKQFLLHYQAQVSGVEKYLMGVEVLVRWNHPERGLVSPGEFIPMAEETGLIVPLGDWVLETACQQLAVWATQEWMSHLVVAVNVSALQFRQPNFVTKLLDTLARTGASASRLKVELTESLLADNVSDIVEKMKLLKGAGVSLSLDDFGTGYSSLAYLKLLPLDQLKIDQSFVRHMMDNQNDVAIIKSVIALAGSFGLHLIAEGVETEGQRDMLLEFGCNAFQGYFFSRPVPLEQFEFFAKKQAAHHYR